MRRKYANNLGLKLISVLVALAIWILVSNNNDPEITKAVKNIPITFKNQEAVTQANKTYTVVDGIDRVNVYVTGRKSLVNKLNSSSFIVKADLENYNEALGTVPLEVTCTESRISQENMRVLPYSLKLNMEDKTEESFGIATSVIGKTAKGYEIGKTTIISGDTVKIAGPTSLIRIIGKVTVQVDISDMSVDAVSRSPIRIEDKNGDLFSDSQMSKLEIKDTDGVVLTDNMAEVDVSVWKVYTDIPVEVQVIGTPEENYRISNISITPKTVNLVAQEEAIEELGGVLRLQDCLSIEGMNKSQEFILDLNDTLANYENIRLEADTTSTIVADIDIGEIGSKTVQVPISNLQMVNVPKEKKLIFSPADYIPVNVKTTDANLEDLDVSQIKVKIDLKNCMIDGNYTIPVEVELPEKYELVDEVTIVVNIEDADYEQEAEASTED